MLPPAPSAPTELRYHRERRELRVCFAEAEYCLEAEFLRVHSPSAEVQGHGGVGGELPLGKAEVTITGIEPVGHYAVKLSFSDGHDTGLYTWDWLRRLGEEHEALWAIYRKAAAAASAAAPVVQRYQP